MTEREPWSDFVDNASVGLHCVDTQGIILWANQTELEFLGYSPEDYVGRPIVEFHQDVAVVEDILARLSRNETLQTYPARLRAKDGSTKFVLINSNMYSSDSELVHTRCFTTPVNHAAWKMFREQLCQQAGHLPVLSIPPTQRG